MWKKEGEREWNKEAWKDKGEGGRERANEKRNEKLSKEKKRLRAALLSVSLWNSLSSDLTGRRPVTAGLNVIPFPTVPQGGPYEQRCGSFSEELRWAVDNNHLEWGPADGFKRKEFY